MDRLPPFEQTALLLDLDGTLIDLAPTPDAVVVEPGLVDVLRALFDALGGAVAIVTGRPVETIDALLQQAVPPVAGEHGGAIRHRADGPIERPALPMPPGSWLDAAERLVAEHPGSLLERKARGFALHFRLAPAAGPAIHATLREIVGDQAGFELLQGHMMWEVRPVGADKGRAVTALMARAPFAGRLPLFIGDDVTDEDAMRVARAMGGAGLRVDASFGTPAGVRSWLGQAAIGKSWPEPNRGLG